MERMSGKYIGEQGERGEGTESVFDCCVPHPVSPFMVFNTNRLG